MKKFAEEAAKVIQEHLDLAKQTQSKLLVILLAENHSGANKSGKHRIMLEGYGYRWYRIGGLTICCIELTSIKRIRARIEDQRNKEKPPRHYCPAASQI